MRLFFEVKGAIVLLDELISLIRSDQARRNRKTVDEPLSMNLSNATSKHEQSTSDLGGQFLHFQLLIDCLLRMKSSSTDSKELIALCQEYYKGNEIELAMVNDFEKYYSPDRALWWYTRETFVYRLLNKALRVLNIDLLYLFRFFLRDMQQQLEQRPCSLSLSLYRCQLISQEEIALLQKSIGKYIAVNSYLSTSVNRSQALAFLNYSSDLERVLFEIEADPRLKGIQPFANITSSSYFPEEEEILFMFGSIFRILSVNCDQDQLWTIRMILVSDEQHEANLLFNHMRNEHGEHETNLLTYGNILRDMSRFDEAEKYYRRFLAQSSNSLEARANCYYSLGMIFSAKGKYHQSLQWHLDSLEMKMQLYQPDDPSLASSFNSIAIVHRKNGNYQQALTSYEKSLAIWKKSFGEDHSKVAKCLNNMGAVYDDQKLYPKALECYDKALTIGEKSSPVDYRALSATHNNLGNVYYKLDDYDQALKHYNEAFEIKSKFLPTQHPGLTRALQNIGMIHEKKGDTVRASEFYKRANDNQQQT